MEIKEQVLYEDNHLIIINKRSSQLIQSDKTEDLPVTHEIKNYLKEKYNKPGNVFLGVPHRLDRPTTGLVIFARTSKALNRLNKMFRQQEINKTYWAVTEKGDYPPSGSLTHFLSKNESNNKSYVTMDESKGKKAILHYKTIHSFESYNLLEVEIETGRHHQIRVQLSHIGAIIRGDVKYGAKRANKDRSISLHSRRKEFIHPVTKELLVIEAPLPKEDFWNVVTKELQL